MLDGLLDAFLLGNAAILTNVCILPLYPGLIAFLAGNSGTERGRRATPLLGVLVLAGILTMMFGLSLVVFLLIGNRPIPGGILLAIYIAVLALGGLMLWGINPFARFAVSQAPILRNPYATAYLYGLLLGPMTLPCAGPILLAGVFTLGVGSPGDFAASMLNFLAFGFGFGWPLVALPLIAAPVQRRMIGYLTRNHTLITRVSGLLLIAVGLFGLGWEYLPAASGFTTELPPGMDVVFWVVAIGLMVALVAWDIYQKRAQSAQETPVSKAGESPSAS